MNILRLTLKKRWFDMILSGNKLEEYREIKPYWEKRLVNDKKCVILDSVQSFGGKTDWKHFDAIEFINGYNPNSPRFTIECKGIEVNYGLQKWGAVSGVKYFVIKLGSIIELPLKNNNKYSK